MPTATPHYGYQWFQVQAGGDLSALNALGAQGWHVVPNLLLPGGWFLLEQIT